MKGMLLQPRIRAIHLPIKVIWDAYYRNIWCGFCWIFRSFLIPMSGRRVQIVAKRRLREESMWVPCISFPTYSSQHRLQRSASLRQGCEACPWESEQLLKGGQVPMELTRRKPMASPHQSPDCG